MSALRRSARVGSISEDGFLEEVLTVGQSRPNTGAPVSTHSILAPSVSASLPPLQQNQEEEVVNQTEVDVKALCTLATEGDKQALQVKLVALEKSGRLAEVINEKDARQMTPLHYAARHGNYECMKILVSHGADRTVTDGQKMTVAHYLARYGRAPAKKKSVVKKSKTKSKSKKSKIGGTKSKPGFVPDLAEDELEDIVPTEKDTDPPGQIPRPPPPPAKKAKAKKVAPPTRKGKGKNKFMPFKKSKAPPISKSREKSLLEEFEEDDEDDSDVPVDKAPPDLFSIASDEDGTIATTSETVIESPQRRRSRLDKDDDERSTTSPAPPPPPAPAPGGPPPAKPSAAPSGGESGENGGGGSYGFDNFRFKRRSTTLITTEDPDETARDLDDWKTLEEGESSGLDLEEEEELEEEDEGEEEDGFGLFEDMKGEGDFNFFVEADLNVLNGQKQNPLHVAAMKGNLFVMKMLLNQPTASKLIEAKDDEDRTPLHLAAMYNQPEAAKLLLKSRCDPKPLDLSFNTPLHLACKDSNKDVVEAFLECKTLYNRDYIFNTLVQAENLEGETPLLIAIKSSNIAIARQLIHFCSDTIKDIDKVFPIHSAALTGNVDMIDLLMKYGASPKILNRAKKSPLYVAAENNIMPVVEYLIDNHVDVNQENVKDQTALMVAAKEGNAEIVKVLVNAEAIVDVSDDDGRSAVHFAAMHDNAEMLETLLTKEEDKVMIEDQDNVGKIPMHIAAERGNLIAAKALNAMNSSLERKDYEKRGPIHWAAQNGHVDVVEYLVQENRSLILSIDNQGRTPLHIACLYNRPKVTEKLLKFGAIMDLRSNSHETPLEGAIRHNHIECVEVLVENHVNVNDTFNERTSLMLASKLGHAEIVRLLLRYNADFKMADKVGRTALCEAILNNHKDAAEAILDVPNWKDAMRACMDGNHRGTLVPVTPFRMMIRYCPALVDTVFKKCLDTKTELDEDDEAWVDFEFLDDSFNFRVSNQKRDKQAFTGKYEYCEEMESKQYHPERKILMANHPLMVMVEEDQMELLKHPVCMALLSRKWKKYGRYIYYGMLVGYLIFLALVTTFALVTSNPGSSNGTCTNDQDSATADVKANIQQVCQIGIIILASISILARIIQLLRARQNYFQWRNLFDWIVHVCGLIMVLDIREGAWQNGLRTCWQWQLGAVTVTMAWMNLLSVIRQLPVFGIYVIMFTDILKTFFQFAIVFVIFIIAFGLGFHILLENQTPFMYVGRSLLKTTIMMIGEFEYEGIFHSDLGPQYPDVTFGFFVGFLVVMSIIIVNLLVGLAVDDIKAVQDQAVLKRLAMQVEQVLDVERMLPTIILRKFTVHKDKMPNNLVLGKEFQKLTEAFKRHEHREINLRKQVEANEAMEQIVNDLSALKELVMKLAKDMENNSLKMAPSRRYSDSATPPVTSTLIMPKYSNSDSDTDFN